MVMNHYIPHSLRSSQHVSDQQLEATSRSIGERRARWANGVRRPAKVAVAIAAVTLQGDMPDAIWNKLMVLTIAGSIITAARAACYAFECAERWGDKKDDLLLPENDYNRFSRFTPKKMQPDPYGDEVMRALRL
jgi:hypothetical protein